MTDREALGVLIQEILKDDPVFKDRVFMCMTDEAKNDILVARIVKKFKNHNKIAFKIAVILNVVSTITIPLIGCVGLIYIFKLLIGLVWNH